MMKRLAVACSLLSLLFCHARAGQGTREPLVPVGVARVDITPLGSMWMSGYASRTRPSEGTEHPLWAKAIAIGAREECHVLVTTDLVGIDRTLSLDLRQRIESRHGIPKSRIAINCSHTHSGPCVGNGLALQRNLGPEQQRLVDDYAVRLQALIVELVGQAMAGQKPCALAAGKGSCDTFAVNRRNNPEKLVPELRARGALRGPVDHDVPVLTARDIEGRLTAIVFGFACHATVTALFKWSGDYPGFAQMAVERAHPGALALFWAGCGADQNPLPRREMALAEKYGQDLAGAVREAIRQGLGPVGGPIRSAYAEIELPYANKADPEALRAIALGPDTKDRKAQWARLVLQRAQRDGGLRESYPYPVQTWSFSGGGPVWIFLGGEVVVDYSLRLKRELAPASVWVAGYSNDVMNYIPSARVWDEGGYEGDTAYAHSYGLPARWSRDIEERIIAEVRRQLGRGP